MNNDQLIIKASNIAKTFFYADANKTPLAAFAGYSAAWLEKQVEDLEQTIYQSFKQTN